MLPRDRAIVYADDSRDDRLFMETAHQDAGIKHRLVLVEDGAQAVEYLEGKGAYANRATYPIPGLMILDLKMPRMDGLKTLAWIRKSERWHRLPVIMLTASIHPGDINRAYDFCVNAFVSKPSTLTDLSALMTCVESFWLRFNEFPGTLSSE